MDSDKSKLKKKARNIPSRKSTTSDLSIQNEDKGQSIVVDLVDDDLVDV